MALILSSGFQLRVTCHLLWHFARSQTLGCPKREQVLLVTNEWSIGLKLDFCKAQNTPTPTKQSSVKCLEY